MKKLKKLKQRTKELEQELERKIRQAEFLSNLEKFMNDQEK